ncbi:MAG TPA: UvrD-helicase domain-containing protein [Ignavibacteria bacterium]
MFFTDNQLKTLDLSKNISVEANAGSGKTAVLVERFVKILLQTEVKDLDSVVGITFTEKAANELRSRIFKKIEEKYSKELDYKLFNILEKISLLKIGTIHSFCSSILREFSVEANIDPNFTILQGIDESLILDEVIDESLKEIISLPDNDALKSNLIELIKIFSLKKVRILLRNFLDKRELLILLNEKIFCRDIEEIYHFWIKEIASFTQMIMDQTNLVDFLLNHEKEFDGELLSHIHSYKNSNTINEKCYYFDIIFSIIFTKTGEIRKKFLKNVNPSYIDEFLNIYSKISSIPTFNLFIKFFSENINYEQIKFQIETTKKLYSIFIIANDKFNYYKDVNAYLDFEDLLIKTRDLLNNETIRQILQKRFKYILVDEYQDTNDLQSQIIYSLIKNNPDTRLFIVGDPKQSIYGFRNADVEIFGDTEKIIVEEKKGEKILLDDSFRLLPDIIVFINYLFKNISDFGSFSFIKYNELIQARKSSYNGKVEFLFYNNSDKQENIEEEMICKKIIQLINSNTLIYDISSDSPRAIEYGDIAILLRSRTHIDILEKTLTKYNIPYLISGGIGYFQTQEIFDLYSYLSFIINPKNDLALVGVLRSPFFYFSDSLLYEINNFTNGNIPFWDKLLEYAKKNADNELVNNAVTILTENILLAQRIPIPNLINKIVIDSNWYGTLQFQESGKQIKANLDKFLIIAREYNKLGYCTLFDFVEKLKTLVYEEDKESQAVIDPTNKMIKIMTIHSAKGLEFPVVFLPYIHQDFKPDNEPYFLNDFGVGFSLPNVNNYDSNFDNTIVTTYIKTINKIKSEEEEKRVLYVALTRAHNMLFISGKYLSSNRRNYLTWIKEAFKLDDYYILDEKNNESLSESPKKIFSIDEIEIMDNLYQTFLENNNYIKKCINNYKLKIKINQNVIESEHNTRIENTEFSLKNYIPNVEKIKGVFSENVFSATALQTYLECPVKYYLKYSLGYPENLIKKNFSSRYSLNNNEIKLIDPDIFIENDSPIVLSNQIKGKIIHSVLEHLNDLQNNRKDISIILNEVLRENLFNIDEINIQELNEIKKIIRNFQESDICKKILSFQKYYIELNLNLSYNGDFLTGFIDRLCIGNEDILIVDYKTNKVNSKNINLYRNIYSPQMIFYAYLVKNYFENKNIKSVLIFLDKPEDIEIIDYTQENFIDFENKLKKILSEIKDVDVGYKEPQKNIEICHQCEYYDNNKCVY